MQHLLMYLVDSLGIRLQQPVPLRFHVAVNILVFFDGELQTRTVLVRGKASLPLSISFSTKESTPYVCEQSVTSIFIF